MDAAIFLPIVSLTKAGSTLIVTARGKVDSYVDDSEYRRTITDMAGGDASEKPTVRRANGLLEVVAKVYSASVMSKLAMGVYKGLRIGAEATGRILSLCFWDNPAALSKSEDYLGLLFKRDLCACRMCRGEGKNNMKKDAARHPGNGKYISTTSESQKEAERMITAADLTVLIDEVLAELLNDFDGHASPAEVLSRARAAAKRTLRRAGIDLDYAVTNDENSDVSLQPERSQQDMSGKPERPAQPEQKVMDCDLFKTLGIVGSDGIGSRETILLNKAQQLVAEARRSLEAERLQKAQSGDNYLLDNVVTARLASDSRQAVAGSSSSLLKGSRERINTLFRGNVLQRTDAISKSDGGATIDPSDTIAKLTAGVTEAHGRGSRPLGELMSDSRPKPVVTKGYVFDIAGRAVTDPVEELAERLAKSAATRRSGKGSAGLLH